MCDVQVGANENPFALLVDAEKMSQQKVGFVHAPGRGGVGVSRTYVDLDAGILLP